MKTIDRAQRVSIPSGGFYLRGVIEGWFAETKPVLEEVGTSIFLTADRQTFQVLTWLPPSKPTSEYEVIPVDWPTGSKAIQENTIR